jgi:UDP-N-acetylmuramoylalanine--D-glutamate ligase
MKWEDLLIDKSQTVAGQAAIGQNRLVSLRNSNRQEIVDGFDKEEHRLEHVTRFQGVYFVDDSMACSVNATYYSFETIKSQVVWIAGGEDANTNYMELIAHVSQKVRKLICIGNDNHKLINTFSKYISNIEQCKNMEDIVRMAFYAAEKRDIVLLSPACQCDGLYSDYQNRGNAFKKAIAQL